MALVGLGAVCTLFEIFFAKCWWHLGAKLKVAFVKEGTLKVKSMYTWFRVALIHQKTTRFIHNPTIFVADDDSGHLDFSAYPNR